MSLPLAAPGAGPIPGPLAGSSRLAFSPPQARPPALPPPALTGFVFVVSFTAMTLIGFVGSPGAVVFAAAWALLALAYGRASLHLLAQGPWLVWLIPAFSLLSVLWSEARGDTFRFGVENALTVACAVLSVRLLRPRALLVALTISLLATSVVSIGLGGRMIDPLTKAIVFVGVFTSKNEVGFFASLMFIAAVAMGIDRYQPALLRLLGWGAVLLSLPLLVLSRSATSVASVAVGAAALLFGLMLSRLDRVGRARMIAAAVLAMLPAALLLLGLGGEAGGFVLDALGRDATLTGRTELWRYADKIIADAPLLGHGFQAFWRHDSVDAETLWASFGIGSRTGFHFHNAYVETAVELGYAGVALLIVTLLGFLVGTIRWSWQTGSVPAAFWVAMLACLIARSFAEVDALQPFQVGTFILYAAGTYAATKPRDDVTTKPRDDVPPAAPIAV